jgi:hypothetical protein
MEEREMSADQEAFEAWRNKTKHLPGVSERDIWQAAIAHIKQNYTLCEKEPRSYGRNEMGQFIELYREAKS